MNYFGLFHLPIQLKVDKLSFHKKFIELCKKYHPDYFATQSDEKQAAALEIFVLLNKACDITISK